MKLCLLFKVCNLKQLNEKGALLKGSYDLYRRLLFGVINRQGGESLLLSNTANRGEISVVGYSLKR